MSDQNQFLLCTAPDGAVKVDVFFEDETVWLTQKALAELFGVQVPGINKHLKNIFDSGELVEDSVISILETTAADGKNYQTRYYNLDAIIAVGYRVNSYEATQFAAYAPEASAAQKRDTLTHLHETLNAPSRHRLLRLTADSPDLLAIIKQEGKVQAYAPTGSVPKELNKRQLKLLHQLKPGDSTSMSTLQKETDGEVSERSLRNDLSLLAKLGHLFTNVTRTRVSVRPGASYAAGATPDKVRGWKPYERK